MDLDLETCRAIAIRHGLGLQFVFKEFHLMNVISQIASLTASEPESLIFKGGTALNKVYLQKTQRFSEDADFDLVTENAGKELLGFSRKLASGLSGYNIDEFRKVRSTVQFYCKYETPLGGTDHVRIDIAPKRLLVANPPQNKPIVSEFTAVTVTGTRVYSIEDLTARKMNALSSRAEGKDVYDVHLALPMCSKKVLGEAIRLMLKSEGAENDTGMFLQKTILRLKKANPKTLRNLTNPFIPSALRPKSWEELKNDLLVKLDNLQK